VNTVENKYIVNMEALSLEDSNQFRTQRLEADEFSKYEKELSFTTRKLLFHH